ncbi:unnamed protein product [marine sediment metagenome]|uniref:Uncharacterized protein n=1 Tax=marine sediment metagenome TaxID=412755 RepID=X1K0V1_9ZZZZ
MVHKIYSSWKTEQNLRQGPVRAYVDELASVLLQQGYPMRCLRMRLAVIGELSVTDGGPR